MGKYTASTTDVFSVFGSTEWKALGINTQPADFIGTVQGGYIRVSVLPSGGQSVNPLKSISGQVLIEIFTPAGIGPARMNEIADLLDDFLSGKTIATASLGQTQFTSSSLSGADYDKANPALYRALYTIPFNFFGA